MNAQLPLGIKLRDSSVFASYFPGRNQPTVDALRAVVVGQPPTCVFVQGPQGSGKSHLLQALCARISQAGHATAYLPLRELASLGPEVLAGCGDLACVCIDDIELIAGSADWERAVFQVHQQLDERQCRLAVASTLAPAATGIRLADLRSRLGGGLVLSLQSLDEDEQIQALQLRAQIRGFDLPLDSAQYLLRRLRRDMSSLFAVLDDLDEASLAAQRRLTVPFMREFVAPLLAASDPQVGDQSSEEQ